MKEQPAPLRLFDREPPHDVDAERAMLGSMMINAEAADRAIQILGQEPDLFYAPQHQAVYDACLAMRDRRKLVDLVTVTDELQKRQQLEFVGGVMVVADLAGASPTSSNVEHYARIVQNKALLRRKVIMTAMMNAAALEQDTETFGAIAAQLDELQRRHQDGLRYEAFQEEWEQEAERPLPWLVPRWLLRDTVTVCAADGGTGKSFLTLGVALSIVTGTEFFPGLSSVERTSVMVVDLENNRDTTIRRIHAYKRRYQMNGHMTTSMRERLHLVHDRGCFITPGPHGRGWIETPFFRQVLADARRIRPGLIVIDHLRRLAGGAEGNDNTAMGLAMEKCDVLARESGAAVLVLAHTNKAANDRGAGKANVRGAGAITDEARCVWEMRRDEEHEGLLTLVRTKANFAATMTNPLAFRLVETGNDAACLESADLPADLQRQPSPGTLAKAVAHWMADNSVIQVSVGSPQNSGGGKRMMQDLQQHWPALRWATVMQALKLARGKGLVRVRSIEGQQGRSRDIWESLAQPGQPWGPEPDEPAPSYEPARPYSQADIGFDGRDEREPAAAPPPPPTNPTYTRPACLAMPEPTEPTQNTSGPLFDAPYCEPEEEDEVPFF